MKIKYQVVEVSFNLETKESRERAVAANLSAEKARKRAEELNRKQDLSNEKVIRAYLPKKAA